MARTDEQRMKKFVDELKGARYQAENADKKFDEVQIRQIEGAITMTEE